MSYQIMTDIETLASTPDAAVIAIGLCCFNDGWNWRFRRQADKYET